MNRFRDSRFVNGVPLRANCVCSKDGIRVPTLDCLGNVRSSISFSHVQCHSAFVPLFS